MRNKRGNMIFEQCPHIVSYASAAGKKEEEGPLGSYFDRIIADPYAGKDTFEQAESEMTSTAVRIALNKGGLEPQDTDVAFCGDLLNQCVASSFAMRSYGIPYAGVYSACSTMALSMILASVTVESGAAHRAVCAASSHYCTAERQYRFPLEYGSQRPPTAQWTVTAAGACIIEEDRESHPCLDYEGDHGKYLSSDINDDRGKYLSSDINGDRGNHPSSDTAKEVRPNGSESSRIPCDPCTSRVPYSPRTPRATQSPNTPYIAAARFGRIVDYGITDQNNMGAAMAPADVKMGT